MTTTARLPQTGDVFAGKYLIEAVLGEGGFGLVLRARAADSNRPVALKILKPSEQGYDLNTATRFLREMRAIAQLQCPFTLTLYDYGKTHGLLYMVTEFVDGEDLSQLLSRRRTLEEREVVHIVYQVLQSLGEAHNLGVLHRDIKPANIRVFEYENNPLMVKVLDFGLAQSLDGAQSKLTATGRVIGTPRYMAPERIGDHPLTPASDFYSLGILAIEMLLGEAAIVRNFGELVTIADDAVHVTPPVRALINRMVAIGPAPRYQSAGEILRALREIRPSAAMVAHVTAPIAPVSAAPATLPPTATPSAAPTAEETVPPPSPGRVRLVGAVVGGLMFLVAVAVMLSRSNREPEARRPPPPVPRAAPPSIVAAPKVEAIPVDAGSERMTGGCGLEHPVTSLQTETWFDGVTPRTWAHYAPDTYDSTREYPVFLLVMDPKAVPEELINHLELRRAARELDAVLVAVGTPGTDSVRIVTQVLDELGEKYCIDRDRVLVMGQAEIEAVVHALTCEGVASARVYRPKDIYGRDEICWDGRVVPTIAFVGFKMEDKTAPVSERALESHNCDGEPEVSDTLSRVRCHRSACETLLVTCRQSGHVHHEVALIAKYRDQLLPEAADE